MTAERDWRALADDVGASLSQALVGRAHGRITIDSVTWYGAVEVDTKHLVVWLLLGSADDYELPAWFSPAGGEWSADPQQADLDPGLLAWMRELRDEVREALAGRGWPSAEDVRITFDSAQRIAERGWSYFNE